MNTVAENDNNTDLSQKTTGSGWNLLFYLPLLFILPPLWGFLLLIFIAGKYKKGLPMIFMSVSLLTLIFTYTTPVWDTIAHQLRYLFVISHDIGEPGWFSKDWFYLLEKQFAGFFGEDIPFMYFWCVVYFCILSIWYLCAKKTAGDSLNEIIFCFFAMIGFLPLLGYTRNALALALVLLPGLTKKFTLPLAIILFLTAYNIHDSIILLSPCLLLYLFSWGKPLGRSWIFFSLILLFYVVIMTRIHYLGISENVFDNSRIATYTSGRGRFIYGSDYIYVTLSLGWCLFLMYNAIKYKDRVNTYMFSLFLISAAIYFAAFIAAQYTIRIRFQIIAITSGLLVTYPILKTHFDSNQWKILRIAITVSFIGYLIFAAQPILLSPSFQDPDLCRNICFKTIYIPTWFLLDIETFGFADWIFKTTTWRVS